MNERLDILISTFSVLNAKSAYWSINIAPQHRRKTAFTDEHQFGQKVIMSFGLFMAPDTFQRNHFIIISPVIDNCCACYLADVFVFVFQKHLKHLSGVLNAREKAGLKMKLSISTDSRVEAVLTCHH